jgi:hypothetical protein
VLTEIGPVQIGVPRDRTASFDPVILGKRQRRLDGIDEIVLSLTARGLNIGEIAAHFHQVYGAKVTEFNERQALLVPPVVLAAMVVGYLIGKLRIGTLDELKAALTAAGADPEQVGRMGYQLAENRMHDVGSARALYLSPGWAPRVAPRLLAAARDRRQAQIDLSDDDLVLLRAALDRFDPDRAGGPSGGSWLRRGRALAADPPPHR